MIQAVDSFLALVQSIQQRPSVAGEDPHQLCLILFLDQRHALPDDLRSAPRISQILKQDAISVRRIGQYHHLPMPIS